MKCSYHRFFIPAIAYACVFLFVLIAGSIASSYLYIVLLFIPLLDPHWKAPDIRLHSRLELYILLLCLLITAALLFKMPGYLEYFLVMLILTAMPEEWFFRVYLLNRIGLNLRGNMLVSVAFSLLHGLTQNIYMMFLVFIPSMIFGYVYIRLRNMYVVILLHALSNLIFIIYLNKWLTDLIGLMEDIIL